VSETVLSVKDLTVTYRVAGRDVAAVDGVSFEVEPGEILGIVGESGCGKSTLSAALLGLLPRNGAIVNGEIGLRGESLVGATAERMRELRGGQIAMVFQDPLTSLNPTFTIGSQLVDALRAHGAGRGSRAEMREKVIAALGSVGIPAPHERVESYPHELSGGQRQRVMIATALMLEPAVLVADEPTSSLDVTLEAQILHLLDRLRREHDTAIVLISHDLGVIAQSCDRVIVMYAGRQVESGDVGELFQRPRHPYTQALLAAAPSLSRRRQRLLSIEGRVPSLSALPGGCKFAPRCSYTEDVCHEREPGLHAVGAELVRCHAYDRDSGYRGKVPQLTSPREEAPARQGGRPAEASVRTTDG
jgi:oligopeptide/dipeptide ABC transporter ATP-binding protein